VGGTKEGSVFRREKKKKKGLPVKDWGERTPYADREALIIVVLGGKELENPRKEGIPEGLSEGDGRA